MALAVCSTMARAGPQHPEVDMEKFENWMFRLFAVGAVTAVWMSLGAFALKIAEVCHG